MTPLPMMPKANPKADADLLSRTHVAKPCHADWAQMTGDERSRFCGSCKKNVYNLSAMTASEAAALIREKEGRLCIRYYQRADGTILTQDCPVGVALFQRKVRRAFAASIVGAASVLMMFTEAMRFATDKPSLFAERLQVWAERLHSKQEEGRIMGGMKPIEPRSVPLAGAPVIQPPVVEVEGELSIQPEEEAVSAIDVRAVQGYAGGAPVKVVSPTDHLDDIYTETPIRGNIAPVDDVRVK